MDTDNGFLMKIPPWGVATIITGGDFGMIEGYGGTGPHGIPLFDIPIYIGWDFGI